METRSIEPITCTAVFYSVSGDFNLVLQQGGVVSVKEDGELSATEVVCEVAEDEQRRRLYSKMIRA